MLVGQQSCLNELGTAYDGHGNAVSSLLHSYAMDNNIVYYMPSVETNKANTHTYFPIVYDRMVKVTSESERCNVYTADQGVYMLGAYSGDKNLNELANQNLGIASYITQNSVYQQSINCALLVIKNNFVTIDRSPIVNYYGCNNLNYVFIYLPNNVTFYTCSEGKYLINDPNKTFTMGPGYYMIPSGAELCNRNNWKILIKVDYRLLKA